MKAWQESGDYTAEELESIKNSTNTWVENFREQLESYTSFSNAEDLESLYNKFKTNSEVAALSDLFEESIENFDSVTYREANKMQYALGHAAVENASLFKFDNYTPATSVYEAVESAKSVLADATGTASYAVINASVWTPTAGDGFSLSIDGVSVGSIANYAGTLNTLDEFIDELNNDGVFKAVAVASKNSDGNLVVTAKDTSVDITTANVTGGTPITGTLTNHVEGGAEEAVNTVSGVLGATNAAGLVEAELRSADDFGLVLPGAVEAVSQNAAAIKKETSASSIVWNDNNGNYYRISFNNNQQVTGVEYDTSAAFTSTDYKNISCNTVDPSTFSLASMTQIDDGIITLSYQIGYKSGVLTMGATDATGSYTFTLNAATGYITGVNDGTNDFAVKSQKVNGSLNTALTRMTTPDGVIVFNGDNNVNDGGTLTVSTIANVETFTTSLGGVYSFSNGNLVTYKDTSGNTVTFDGSGVGNVNVETITSADGTISRLTDGEISEVTYGEETYGVSVDDDGNTVVTAKTEDGTYTYTFKDGMLYKAVDPFGNDVRTVTLAAGDILTSVFGDAAEEAESRDYAGFTIATQEDAQRALAAINDAIVVKDKIRANLGSLQNRLENTISNINIQAENLQAAESRISDVDVSTEMTEFVRQQILTQSAVAMLSQANSLPQMAMQLIGG